MCACLDKIQSMADHHNYLVIPALLAALFSIQSCHGLQSQIEITKCQSNNGNSSLTLRQSLEECLDKYLSYIKYIDQHNWV